MSRRADEQELPGSEPADVDSLAQTDVPGTIENRSLTIERNESVFEENVRSVVQAGLLEEAPEYTAVDSQMVADLAQVRWGAPAYDPDRDAGDRLAHQRYEANIERRSAELQQVNAADDRLRDRERRLAELGPRPEEPGVRAVAVLGVVGGGLGLGITFGHLLFAGLGFGSGVELIAGLAAGWLVAGLVASGMLGSARLPDARGYWIDLGWLLVPLGLAAVVFLMRLGYAQGPAARGVALGLALLVLVCFGSIELSARGLRGAWAACRRRAEPWESAAMEVQAAQRLVQAREAGLAAAQREIDLHEAEVRRRGLAHQQGLDRADAARQTAVAGKARGLFESRGRVFGGLWKLPTATQVRARHHGRRDETRSEEDER